MYCSGCDREMQVVDSNGETDPRYARVETWECPECNERQTKTLRGTGR